MYQSLSIMQWRGNLFVQYLLNWCSNIITSYIKIIYIKLQPQVSY